METFHPKVSFDLKEIHLAHGHLEQRKAELLGALYGTKEEREGSHSTTGVPENWLPPWTKKTTLKSTPSLIVRQPWHCFHRYAWSWSSQVFQVQRLVSNFVQLRKEEGRHHLKEPFLFQEGVQGRVKILPTGHSCSCFDDVPNTLREQAEPGVCCAPDLILVKPLCPIYI